MSYDFELYNYLKTLENNLKEKHNIEFLTINLESDKNRMNSIYLMLNHEESKDIEKEIISEISNLLKAKNYNYEFVNENLYSTQISDLIDNTYNVNEISTMDIYRLKPKIKD